MADVKTRDAEPDTGAVADSAGPAAAAPTPSVRRSSWTAVMTVLTLALVALTTAAVVLFFAGEDPASRQRGPVLAAAEKVALGVTGLDAANVDTEIATLEGLATAGFRAELEGYRQSLGPALVEEQVSMETRLGAIGLERLGTDSALALVAVTATARSAGSPEAEERRYRLAVELQREDGRWLVSSVGFVP